MTSKEDIFVELPVSISWEELESDYDMPFINIQNVEIVKPPQPQYNPPRKWNLNHHTVNHHVENMIVKLGRILFAAVLMPFYLVAYTIALWPLWLIILLNLPAV